MAKLRYVLLYGLIVVGVIVSYGPAKEVMIRQDAWVRVVDSPVTVNLLLLLFMWGVMADRSTKGMPKKRAWLIWGIGTGLLIIMFRLVGGIPTIFG